LNGLSRFSALRQGGEIYTSPTLEASSLASNSRLDVERGQKQKGSVNHRSTELFLSEGASARIKPAQMELHSTDKTRYFNRLPQHKQRNHLILKGLLLGEQTKTDFAQPAWRSRDH